jgi:hypothetical protein
LHPEVVSARRQYLAAAQVTLSVLAVIQEQALEVQRKSGRVVIKSRRPRRLQRTRAKAKARPGKPARIDLQLPATPAFVHSIAIDPGPLPAGAATAKVVRWKIHCTKCPTTCLGSGRWGAFMRSICTSHPMAVHARRENLPHALFPVHGGWACQRCRLPVAPGRRAAAEVAQCPFPEIIGLDGLPCLSSRLQLQCNADIIAAWHHFRKADGTVAIPAPPVVPIARLQWRSHWRLVLGRKSICLNCGKSAAFRSRNSLASSSCIGPIETPSGALLAPLRAGAFDAALAAATSTGWRERAAQLGWRPVVAHRASAGPFVAAAVAHARRADPAHLPPA